MVSPSSNLIRTGYIAILVTRYQPPDPQREVQNEQLKRYHDDQSHERWPSPTYPALIGNVIPEFLSFSGNPFPAPPRQDQPFPTLRETFEYLATFARPLLGSGKIRLHHEVLDVAEIQAEEGGGWRVVMTDWSKAGGVGVRKEERWDAVVITTVWYDNEYYPNIEGLDDIKKTGRVRHAKTWRGPSGYEGKVWIYRLCP